MAPRDDLIVEHDKTLRGKKTETLLSTDGGELFTDMVLACGMGSVDPFLTRLNPF